jgi:hypothetical protein
MRENALIQIAKSKCSEEYLTNVRDNEGRGYKIIDSVMPRRNMKPPSVRPEQCMIHAMHS